MTPLDWTEAVEACAKGNVCAREAWTTDDMLRFWPNGQLYSTVTLTEADVSAEDWIVLGKIQ